MIELHIPHFALFQVPPFTPHRTYTDEVFWPCTLAWLISPPLHSRKSTDTKCALRTLFSSYCSRNLLEPKLLLNPTMISSRNGFRHRQALSAIIILICVSHFRAIPSFKSVYNTKFRALSDEHLAESAANIDNATLISDGVCFRSLFAVAYHPPELICNMRRV